MFRNSLYTVLLVSAGLPGAALADTCADGLKALRTTYAAGSPDEILSAVSNLRVQGGCNDATARVAVIQASSVIANRAGRFVASGDLDRAEAIVALAPGLHWAVQAVRGDIAAARGNREEAAQLYNAALDTIMDPVLTPAKDQLVPVAERLARLAQENTMLAGTLQGSITRGGAASGVLKAAQRGIAIESIIEIADKPDPDKAPVKDDVDYTEKPEATVVTYDAAPEKAGSHDASEKHADIYADPPAKTDDHKEPAKGVTQYVDPYGGGKKEDYKVADEVAKITKAVFLPIKFGTDADFLDAKAKYEADFIGAFLKANKIREITLIGHTDERGSDAYNLDLSFRRAQAVRDYLSHYLTNFDSYTYIQVDGKGERVPPKLSDPHLYSTKERQAIARRVELVLHK